MEQNLTIGAIISFSGRTVLCELVGLMIGWFVHLMVGWFDG
jgi:hypothetical protein